MSTQPENADSGNGTGPDGRSAGRGRDSGRESGRDSGRESGRDSGRDAGRGRDPGRDLTAEFQRWLIRSSARNVRQELTGQFRRTLGRAERENVWEVATTEPPHDPSGEAPECAWCPVCRAARRIRESAPSVGGQLAGASDVVAAAVQEAMRAFEAAMSMGQRGDRAPGFPADAYPADRFPADRFPVAGAPGEGADHEPDDRD
jgi:hypothetical protein